MCSGKSTVGKLLARELGWEFVDVDEEIERREGLSIPQIFERKGEPYFRELELEMLRELSDKKQVVVSTGGGLGANPDAMNLMKRRGLVVWLDVPYDTFLERCGKDPNRPLLKKSEEELRRLMEDRNRVYSQADVRVKPGKPEEIVDLIIEKLRGEPHDLSRP